jgi:hypothetical protein
VQRRDCREWNVRGRGHEFETDRRRSGSTFCEIVYASVWTSPGTLYKFCTMWYKLKPEIFFFCPREYIEVFSALGNI